MTQSNADAAREYLGKVGHPHASFRISCLKDLLNRLGYSRAVDVPDHLTEKFQDDLSLLPKEPPRQFTPEEWRAEAMELLRIAQRAHAKMGLEGRGSDCSLPHEVREFALEFSRKGRDGPGALQVRGTGRFWDVWMAKFR